MNKNNKVLEKLNEIQKDRLDFGFDSIYFRYAEAIDELMMYRIIYEHKDLTSERRRAGHQKMRFWETLEQLVHAHPVEENKNGTNS